MSDEFKPTCSEWIKSGNGNEVDFYAQTWGNLCDFTDSIIVELRTTVSDLQSECETAMALVMSHESTIEGQLKRIAELEQENERLKKQIYHMRNCVNCENPICDAKQGKFVNDCLGNDHEHWKGGSDDL